jgi:hypothetical protein
MKSPRELIANLKALLERGYYLGRLRIHHAYWGSAMILVGRFSETLPLLAFGLGVLIDDVTSHVFRDVRLHAITLPLAFMLGVAGYLLPRGAFLVW